MGRVLLGTSGWSYNEWVGAFYEDEKQSKLKHYNRIFNTVEINSTFYAYPRKELVYGWVKHSPPDFIYSAKLPKIITHEKMLAVERDVEGDLKRFCELLEPLAYNGKLGPLLIQCRPKFKYDLECLEQFFKILPKGYDFAIEFRNLSWVRDETFDLLSEFNVAYTIVDEPLLPSDVWVTADFSYIRWHGHGKKIWFDYKYSLDELEPWVAKVEEVSNKSKRLFGYFNNHFHGYAVENCLQIMEMMGSITPEQKSAKKRFSQKPSENRQRKLLTYFEGKNNSNTDI